MKRILSLLAVALSLVACTNVPENPEAQNAWRVVTEDAKFLSDTKTISELVNKMDALSLAGCPEAFTKAYQEHKAAWTKVAKLEKEMLSENMKNASSDISSFISDIRSNRSEAVVKLANKWPKFADKINSAMADTTKTLANLKVEATKLGVAYPNY